MRLTNLVLGLVVTLIGAVAMVEATDLDMFGELGVPGPGFLPNLVAGMLVVLGLLLTAVTLPRRRSPAAEAAAADDAAAERTDKAPAEAVDAGADDIEPAEPTFEVSGVLRAGRVWIGLLLSVPAMVLLGFVPAMVLLMAYLIFAVERMRGVPAVLTTFLVPAVTYAIFAFLLGVDLPASELFGRS